MTSPAFEAFLARIYVDAEARERFLENPRAAALSTGLTESEASALERIDRTGLALAAESLEAKRGGRARRRPRT
jgi:hypothetical protein